jgi:hypothetical protein
MQRTGFATGISVLGMMLAGLSYVDAAALAAEPDDTHATRMESASEHGVAVDVPSMWLAQTGPDELDLDVLSCTAVDAEFVAVGRIDVEAMAGAGWFTAEQIDRLLRVADEAMLESAGVSVRDTSSWSGWVSDDGAAACFRGARLAGSVADAISASGGNAVQRGSAWIGEAGEMLVVGNAHGVAATQAAVLGDVASPIAERLRVVVDSETLLAFFLQPHVEPGETGPPIPGLTSGLMVMSARGVFAQAEFDTAENAAGGAATVQRMIALWRAQLTSTLQSQGLPNMFLGTALVAVTQEATAIVFDEQLQVTIDDRTLTLQLAVEGLNGDTFFYPILAGIMMFAIDGALDGRQADETGEPE